MHGHLELVRLLVERGADLTIPDRTYSSTPLGWAVYGEAPEVIRYFKTVPDRLDIWDAIEAAAAVVGEMESKSSARSHVARCSDGKRHQAAAHAGAMQATE